MYPNPMWGYPPPQMDQNTLEKGIRLAMKIAQREEREKERKKHFEHKHKEEQRRRYLEGRARMFTSLEWFIIGIISYPIVGPLYTIAINNLQNYVK